MFGKKKEYKKLYAILATKEWGQLETYEKYFTEKEIKYSVGEMHEMENQYSTMELCFMSVEMTDKEYSKACKDLNLVNI